MVRKDLEKGMIVSELGYRCSYCEAWGYKHLVLSNGQGNQRIICPGCLIKLFDAVLGSPVLKESEVKEV